MSCSSVAEIPSDSANFGTSSAGTLRLILTTSLVDMSTLVTKLCYVYNIQ